MALMELEEVLRDNGVQQSSSAPLRRCIFVVPLLLALFLLMPLRESGGSRSDSSRRVTASHSPLGPISLDAASGCAQHENVGSGGEQKPLVTLSQSTVLQSQARHEAAMVAQSQARHEAAMAALRAKHAKELAQARLEGVAPVDANEKTFPSQELPGAAWHRRPRSGYPVHDAFDHPRDALKSLRSGMWNASDFPLLLCIGQGKTATKSLNKAFVMMGMNTAHFYGAGVYGLLFDNAAERSGHSFQFNVNEPKHVAAVLDTPVVDFYHEILLSYPRAWVVLTVRKTRSWVKSQQKFYGGFAGGCRKWLAPWRRGSNLIYGTECPSKEQALKRYVQHNRNVYDSVDPSRLLVMDMPGGDGWDKLCPFLKKAGLSNDCPPTNLTLCRKAGVRSCVFPNRK